MKHNYMIFGYRVYSEFELDAYESEFDKPDVIVENGQISCDKEALVEDDFYSEFDDDLIAFNVPNIGAYEIKNGNKITVQPVDGAVSQELSLFILGSAFGFLMHQNRVFPLHGSTVDIGYGCITLVGHSGAGKTALASGFVERGYKLLADDVSRIERVDDVYYVHPSYPSQKIWKDGIEKLALNFDPKQRVMTQLEKFHINSRERFCNVQKPLIAIIEIYPSDVNDPTLVKIEKPAVLNALITHSYLQDVMASKTYLSAHLQFCSSLSNSVPVYRILRPSEGFTVREQVEAIEKQFVRS